MNLGKVILAWRNQHGLSVREAAEIIGINYSTVSRLERGKGFDGETVAKTLKWLLSP